MYYLAACLVFKDAASYLDEWIRFHQRVGFEHFYLYDNDSTDDYAAVIRPFLESGRVTLTKWPGVAPQNPAFQHCLDQHRGVHWISFLDDDEFLFPATGTDLRDVLAQYESHAGVAVCWQLFGSSGHQTRPQGLVTQNYRRRAAWIDPHVKCIVDPTRVIAPLVDAHAFQCVPGEAIVDEKRHPMTGPFCEGPSAEMFCLNHYITKSHEEMVRRRTRAKGDGGANVLTIRQWEEFDAQYNSVEDLRIQRFVEDLVVA